jgi:hypothetical protein
VYADHCPRHRSDTPHGPQTTACTPAGPVQPRRPRAYRQIVTIAVINRPSVRLQLLRAHTGHGPAVEGDIPLPIHLPLRTVGFVGAHAPKGTQHPLAAEIDSVSVGLLKMAHLKKPVLQFQIFCT